MIRTIILTTIFSSLLIFSGCNQQKSSGPTGATLKSDDDKAFYTVGLMFGSRLKNLDLSDQELSAIYLGLFDSAKGKKPQVDGAKYQKKVQEMFKKRIQAGSVKVKKSGNDYIEKFLKEAGAKKTASGLAYQIIKPGSGKSPKASDIVEVHYHGTLIDGTVFDSSVDRKKKISFPLNRVIKGWTEGLQLVKIGGKIKLVIPSDLAYGDQGAPPKIPGGATLVFEVELFSIKDAPAPKKRSAPKKKSKK
ncbi:MAG: FKBP-type peptidyl-prolyl cis-trans isomerase [Bdellovibrionales bacterium]|nr:FKBP-type peptidyl-prolyl cis-trans isomerase [Bdellovibrionales bacterium]MBT3526123.1 FKBP-type peptidyl-prolyl cis-trans isomerase [Bdellovibrionales bacterium]MBT7670258.1 FKBP-type peptidyl-prolyl cis-trans isomerase [Bdellovibrionales bacterium]MBT7767314.1 FKBP-type peptidyl-prolyl cis-trans isomerase [Bdellovibrionales bacterium]